MLNGGSCDDGFDYFRGWLIAQGRATFERIVADRDALAELPIVRTSAADGLDLDCEGGTPHAASRRGRGRRHPNERRQTVGKAVPTP